MSIDNACLLIIGLVAVGGIANRLLTHKGIGTKFCQFLAIGMGISAIIMLAYAGKIDH